MVDREIVDLVLSYKAKGAQVLFRSNHFGLQKIKIKYGPFGLFTKRIETDAETADHIKRKIIG